MLEIIQELKAKSLNLRRQMSNLSFKAFIQNEFPLLSLFSYLIPEHQPDNWPEHLFCVLDAKIS